MSTVILQIRPAGRLLGTGLSIDPSLEPGRSNSVFPSSNQLLLPPSTKGADHNGMCLTQSNVTICMMRGLRWLVLKPATFIPTVTKAERTTLLEQTLINHVARHSCRKFVGGIMCLCTPINDASE